MALVAYASSDDSDISEDEHESLPSTSKKLVNLPLSVNSSLPTSTIIDDSDEEDTRLRSNSPSISTKDDESSSDSLDNDEPVDISSSFSKLRAPQHDKFQLDGIKSKITNSGIFKKLQTIRLPDKKTVSQLRKLREHKEGSGLLSRLPNPTKVEDSFIPTTPSTAPITNAQSSLKLLPRALTQKKHTGNDSDEDDVSTDFFALSNVEPSEDKFKDIDLTSFKIEIENSTNKMCSEKSIEITNNTDEPCSSMEESTESDITQHTVLDDDAIHKLCGRKRKGQNLDEIQFIDVHEADILAETKRSLTKSLTEEVPLRPPSARPGGVSSLSKRKHQITYLAFQAKERELELKNQWANNRFTKRQTQSKYGFI